MTTEPFFLHNFLIRVLIWLDFLQMSHFEPPEGPGTQAYFSDIFNNWSLVRVNKDFYFPVINKNNIINAKHFNAEQL